MINKTEKIKVVIILWILTQIRYFISNHIQICFIPEMCSSEFSVHLFRFKIAFQSILIRRNCEKINKHLFISWKVHEDDF